MAAAVASAAYISGLAVLNAAGVELGNHAAGYISAVLFLLPGFALITGALDIVKLDLSAGTSCIVFGTTMTLAAGASVWAVSLAETLSTAERLPVVQEWWLQWLLWAGASACGVAGFALLFNSPWRLAASAAGIGLIANTGRLASIDHGLRAQAATALACVVVGVLAAWVARGGRWPVITLSVPAVLTVLAIMVGLVIAKLLTDRDWATEKV